MVKLVCYNIEYCEGMEGLWYQYFKLWRTLFPPKKLDQKIMLELKKLSLDILALVEVDTGSFRAKKDEVFHFVPIMHKQANAIISKYKISQVRYHLFHEGTKRVVIESTIHCPQKITLLLAHLALGGKARYKQLEELINIVNSIKNPIILLGDFNTFHGAHEIQRLLRKTHLKDKAYLDKDSRGWTEPTWHPLRRLDYVLVSKQIKVSKYKVLKFPFSDHMPLYVEFEVKK